MHDISTDGVIERVQTYADYVAAAAQKSQGDWVTEAGNEMNALVMRWTHRYEMNT